MALGIGDFRAVRSLSRDGKLLFATRCLRLFGYGMMSFVLVLYLIELGVSEKGIGLLISLTLIGDTAISLWITTRADRMGRRRMLMMGAVLMILAGLIFGITDHYWLLLFAAIIGVISPSGNEVGPFLSIEQASLSHIVPDRDRTAVFAWYNLMGSLSTATGALVGGKVVTLLPKRGWSELQSYQCVVFGYAALGILLVILFLLVTPKVECPSDQRTTAPMQLGLRKSKKVVFKLSSLFALDAFGGGFILQSFVVYWFVVRFQADKETLGKVFFCANILAGVSALTAVALARRIGLITTMVVTHIPSNLLLILIPLMPNLPLAITVLLLRFSISQMDVPTRQSYTMAVVDPDERSAAAGITNVTRSAGAAISPSLVGMMQAMPSLFSAPFYLAGGLKIVYDLLLWRSFRAVRPPEEGG
ncbi:MAG: MFS transporter [Phycisphaerae bacterium]|nr:MFS transporter [Phycisphaerae bacterium]